MNVLNHIIANPPPAGHRIAFHRLDGVETLDLRDLYERAGRLAVALGGLGVRRGDRIGVLAPNGLEWVLLDLAALRLGAVSVGFDPAKFDAPGGLPDRYGLVLLFTDRPADAPRVLPLGDARKLSDSPVDETPELVHYGPEDPTSLKLTSGSTGEPKGMTASAGSVDAGLRGVQEMFRHGDGDNLFVFLPLSVLQQRYWVYSALRFGHDVTISTYEAAFPAMGRARPTVVMEVPGFFDAARRHIEARGPESAHDLFGGRIRYLWTGSAPASAGVLRFLTDLGLPIFEGYGLNETCIVSKNHPGAHRPGSAGKLLPGKEVLLDPDGVISVRSEYPVCRRYEYAAPGESERVFGPDGTVRTGDLGYIDEDGFLFIRGRADDVIVLANGRKVVVRPIEEHLKASPAIEECVLFCPTEAHLVAVVSPAQDPPDRTAIAEQLARTNAAFGRDERIRYAVVARDRFGIANGLLTSQLKPRRGRIFDAYRAQIHDPRGAIHAD